VQRLHEQSFEGLHQWILRGKIRQRGDHRGRMAEPKFDHVTLYTSPPLSTGGHTVTLTVTGTKNPAATDAVVTIDRIIAHS
jgi:hypothetical protein